MTAPPLDESSGRPRRVRSVTAPSDRMPRWVPKVLLLAVALIIGVATTYWLVVQLQGLLLLLAVSLFLSFAIEPAVNRLEARGMRRGMGTGLVFLVVAVVLGGFSFAIGAVLIDQVTTLVDEAPSYIEDVEVWVERNFDVEVETDELIDEFRAGGGAGDLASGLADDILDVGVTVVTLAFQVLTVTLFTFYLVADAPRLRRAICSLLEPDRQREVLRAWSIAVDKTGGYLYSRAILALLSFLAHWAAFVLIGVPSPLPLALWVGAVSQFIPVVGTYLAGVLPVLVSLTEGPVAALWVLGVIVVYQQIENYLFLPRITAQTMAMHPAVAFGAVIAGAGLFGPIGALLALPAAATGQGFVSEYLNRHELIEAEELEGGEVDEH